MTTLNISMPDAMRAYVEACAAKGHYSASEYVRHLIREDQKKREQQERDRLWELLSISAHQLDRGEYAEITAADILKAGRARRSANSA